MIISHLMSIKSSHVRQDYKWGKQDTDKRPSVRRNKLLNVKELKDEIKILMNSGKCIYGHSRELNLNSNNQCKPRVKKMPKFNAKCVFKTIICIISIIFVLRYLFNYEKFDMSFELNSNRKITKNYFKLRDILNYNRECENISKIEQNFRFVTERVKRIHSKHFRKKYRFP